MNDTYSTKNKIFVGCLLIILSTFFSCKKLLEIPVNPPNAVIRETLFADSATAMTAVAGVYSYTNGGGGIPYQDGGFIAAVSQSAHDVIYTAGFGDNLQFYNYTLLPVNAEIDGIWSQHYKEIYQVNDIISNITGNARLSAPFINQITGEMKFVRAYMYFILINVFGDVPLVTTTNFNINSQSPRVAVSTIYSQINADLNDAAKRLSVTYPQGSPGHVRANLYTVRALQAKVHLYQGKWQAAFNEADSIINSGGFSLLTNLKSVFLDGSNEAIWQVPIEIANGGSGDAKYFIPRSTSTINRYVATDSLIKAFEPGDLRFTNWMGVSTVAGVKQYYPAKYKDRTTTNPATDFMLLRYAEMYLIRAEAAAKLGTGFALAVADINTIRTRSGLNPVMPTTATAILAAVRKERRTELFAEMGNRWFDLNRTVNDTQYPASGQAPNVLLNYSVANGTNLYPVPQIERQLNPTLTQNPGYH